MLILVPAALYDDLIPTARTIAPGLTLAPYEENETPIEGLDEAVGVLRWTRGKRYAGIIADGPHIRWLHTESAGVDHVLTPAVCAKPGLVVTDSGAAYEIAVSEFVLAWMLLVARRLPALMALQRAHRWEWTTQEELYGKTVGIIGLGPIGRGVAARAQAFGMQTLGRRRRPEPVPSVDELLTGADGLRRLLRESDFVVLAAAATPETRGLIGPEQLALLKPSAWLINIARGALVDEAALLNVLQAGRIGGACLDVFTEEPLPPDSPFWDLPNVHIAPHSSTGWTSGLRARLKAVFLDNLGRFARGESLQGVVEITRGY